MASPSNKGEDVRESSEAQIKLAPLQEVYESAPVVEPGGDSEVSEKGNNRRRTDSDDRDKRKVRSDEASVVTEKCNFSRSGRRILPSKRLFDYDDLGKKSGDEKLKVEEGEGGGRRKSKMRKLERCEGINVGDGNLIAAQETRSNGKDKSKGVDDGEKGEVGSDPNLDDQNGEKGKAGSDTSSDDQNGEKGKFGRDTSSDDHNGEKGKVERDTTSHEHNGEKGKVGRNTSSDDQNGEKEKVGKDSSYNDQNGEKGKVGRDTSSDDHNGEKGKVERDTTSDEHNGKDSSYDDQNGEKGKVGKDSSYDDQNGEKGKVGRDTSSHDQNGEKGEVGSDPNLGDQNGENGKVGRDTSSDDQNGEKGKGGSDPNSDDENGEKGKVGSSANSDDREHSSDEVGVEIGMCNYSRSGRRLLPSKRLFDYDDLIKQEISEVEEGEGEGEGGRKSKKRKVERREVISLGNDSKTIGGLSADGETRSKEKKIKGSAATRREWTRLSIGGDAEIFIGFNCKVYWPADDSWYQGQIVGYNPETDRHHVKYHDGDEEHLVLSNERILFFVSPKEIQFLGLSSGFQCSDTDNIDEEVVNLAATLGDVGPLVPGDILWAKVAGHPWWPAIVLDESTGFDIIGLNKISEEKTVLVQFFGTYEFARVRENEITGFLEGSLRNLKCKKPHFNQSLEEAKMYICNNELPKLMLSVRKQNVSNSATANGEGESSDEGTRVKENRKKLEDLGSCPFEIGDLQIISLGEFVEDSDCFLDDNYICPEGYTALRKFPSISDPNKCISYKMEVIRDDNALDKPLFRVTSEKGEKFEGPTSSSCWDKIDRKIRKMQLSSSDAFKAFGGRKKTNRSGPDMFGFSHPDIVKLIQLSSTPKVPLEVPTTESKNLPVGYRPVVITWKDLDKCNVCDMEEEYENNLLLQCDKCRMMVHSRCYGEQGPVDGILWYCNLCRSGAPEYSPPCCLCPLRGGAMKPTTDGRWAHLACAIWIPETCLVDVKKMEPIDGLNRIKKDRWRLLCSICGVSYGACIQCSNSSCYVAYHPLCARAAGFCLEPEGEDRCRLISRKEDEYNQCIWLLSFCKKHKSPSNHRTSVIGQSAHQQLDYIPPPNPSGCARTELYNYLGQRGTKDPEAHGSVSLKHLYVENRPHLVGGYSQHDSFSNVLLSQSDTPRNIFSMVEKYNHMSRTYKKRLAFGKSRIHGYGVFAKEPHLAGDMVIEYIGQVVRAPIADRREYLIYNSFVGAGTYMFRIDDERVIDATKAGSIARLINHSCEPNCYSRIITVNDDEHIIIFAKRDIKQREELTYDYRIFSTDEQLACSCGFPRCRGVVNYIGPYEPLAKQCVPLGDLTLETRTSGGQVVRTPIVDRSQCLTCNSFVGGGTYMFQIDNERVIDATKARSIAHLINHSSKPNCYSRIITVNGDENLIILAKGHIKQWEELTYDYRIFSNDEQLACYCRFPRCQAVVNYIGPYEPNW